MSSDAVLRAARRVVEVARPGEPMPAVVDAVEALREALKNYDAESRETPRTPAEFVALHGELPDDGSVIR